VWRAHGLDRILHQAWNEGVVLSGISAGMNCWFAESLTDSYGLDQLAPLRDGLAFLSGSCCPHYDGEVQRRPNFQRLILSDQLAAGFAADDGAALLFSGEELTEVVTSRPGAGAYRVEKIGADVHERRLPVRYLGS